ncbi:ribose-phosphate pyrophosphokinase [Deltaproteobacteria bacterium]|nr:ribose-phosphate pyrophosphokinase [Deltaproteobacteria bacterium]
MEIRLFAGNANPVLARSIAEHLGCPMGAARVTRFSDGEIQVEIEENVRGRDVYLLQPTSRPANDHIMELLIMADACKRASAGRVTAVVPYYGYSRQDRKVAPRAPISAKLVADLIQKSGIDRMVTMDLHAGQIQGFFDIPVDNLYGGPTLSEHIRRNIDVSNCVVVSPDAGGVERARGFAKRIGATIAIIDKRRTGPNKAEVLHLIGDVRDRTAIIVDDMIDTAGTMQKAAAAVQENGATSVYAVATHAVLSGPAVERINESVLKMIFVTDTIVLTPEAAACPKIKTVPVGPVLAEAIRSIHSNDSVSRLFR